MLNLCMVGTGDFCIPWFRNRSKIFSPRSVVIGNLTNGGFLSDGSGGRCLRYASSLISDLSTQWQIALSVLGAFFFIAHHSKTRREFPRPEGEVFPSLSIQNSFFNTYIVDSQRSINYETKQHRRGPFCYALVAGGEADTTLCERSWIFILLLVIHFGPFQAPRAWITTHVCSLCIQAQPAAQPPRTAFAGGMERAKAILPDVGPRLHHRATTDHVPQLRRGRANQGLALATCRTHSLTIQLSSYDYPNPAHQGQAPRCAHDSESLTHAPDFNLLPRWRHPEPIDPRATPTIPGTLPAPLRRGSADIHSDAAIGPQGPELAQDQRKEGGSHV